MSSDCVDLGCAFIGSVRVDVSISGSASGDADGTLTTGLIPPTGVAFGLTRDATISESGGTFSYGNPSYFNTAPCGTLCIVMLELPFALGEQFILDVDLEAWASTSSSVLISEALFSDTAKVTSLGLCDEFSALVTDVIFNFASNVIYPMADPPPGPTFSVPESTTLALLGIGLIWRLEPGNYDAAVSADSTRIKRVRLYIACMLGHRSRVIDGIPITRDCC